MDGLLDTVRRLLRQPLGPIDRRRLATVCIGALALAAVLLSTVRTGPAVPQAAPGAAEVLAPAATATPVATRDPAVVPIPVEEESEPPPAREIAAAKRAARGFLRGYFPLANGRGDADALAHLSEDLRADLLRHPPRPANTWDADRPAPAIQSMQVTGSSPDRIGLLVLAVDGDLPVSFRLGLTRYAEGWLVTEVGG